MNTPREKGSGERGLGQPPGPKSLFIANSGLFAPDFLKIIKKKERNAFFFDIFIVLL